MAQDKLAVKKYYETYEKIFWLFPVMWFVGAQPCFYSLSARKIREKAKKKINPFLLNNPKNPRLYRGFCVDK